MALYCTYVQNGVYNAPDDRFAQGAVFARDTAGNVRKGIIAFGANDGAATVVAGTLSVTVQPFTAVIPDAGGRGAYVGGVDSATVVDALAPETTNNRVDVLCFRHLEGQSTDSGGASTLGPVTLAGQDTAITKQIVPGELYWVKGTPSASSSPSAPAVPANAVPIARVYVAGGATALTGANLTDVRVFTGLHGARVTWPGVSESTNVGAWPLGTEFAHPSNGRLYAMTSGGLSALESTFARPIELVTVEDSGSADVPSGSSLALRRNFVLTPTRSGLARIDLYYSWRAAGNSAGRDTLIVPGVSTDWTVRRANNSSTTPQEVTLHATTRVTAGVPVNIGLHASTDAAGVSRTLSLFRANMWVE